MIKFLIFVLISVSFLNSSDAALARLPPQPKPPKFENEEGCYVPMLDKMLKFNEIYAPPNGDCIRYSCHNDGDTVLASCGVVHADEGCRKIPRDLSLSYPDCCEHFVCERQESSEEDNTV